VQVLTLGPGGQAERESHQGERKRQRWREKERKRKRTHEGAGISTCRGTKGEVGWRRRSSLRDLPCVCLVCTYDVRVHTRESQLKTIDQEKAAKYVDETTSHDFMPVWNNNRDESEKKAHMWREKST